MPFELVLPVAWIMAGPWWLVLTRALIICPIIPMCLGPVFESRWVPLSPRYQFSAFFPGNPYVALYLAASSTIMSAPITSGIWQSKTAQWFIAGCTFVVYQALNRLDRKAYTDAARRGPTKRYHNLLYFWYIYLVVAVTIAVVSAQVSFWHRVFVMLPGLLWVGCYLRDLRVPQEELDIKFQTAHAGWCPIWRHWKLRRMVQLRHSRKFVYVFPGSTVPVP